MKRRPGINAAAWFRRRSFRAVEAEQQAQFYEARCATCKHPESRHERVELNTDHRQPCNECDCRQFKEVVI